jgi:trehalose/maltose transport system permease protein
LAAETVTYEGATIGGPLQPTRWLLAAVWIALTALTGYIAALLVPEFSALMESTTRAVSPTMLGLLVRLVLLPVFLLLIVAPIAITGVMVYLTLSRYAPEAWWLLFVLFVALTIAFGYAWANDAPGPNPLLAVACGIAAIITFPIEKLRKKLAFYSLIVVIIVFSVFPFYYAIVTSFKTGGGLFKVDYWPPEPSLANYTGVFETGYFGQNILSSLFVSTVVVAISLFLAVTAAYALGRIRFRGRTTLLLTILSVSMFPQVAVLAGLFQMLPSNSLWSLIFSYMIFTLPFTVWVLTTFMRDLPIELEEAALTDGASTWTIIFRVFLPLMWPAMVTTGLLAFIAAWNEFLFALTFVSNDALRTVPLAIAFLSGASEHEIPWGKIMAASVIVTVPLIVLVLIFQRKIVSGLTAGAVKG